MLNAGESYQAPKQPPVTRDDLYFLEQVFFQVENSTFAVPKHHFGQSRGIFATIFTLQPEQGRPTDGSSENQPFCLPGTTKEEFRSFLKILHPLQVPPDYSAILLEEWVMILKLSTMWRFRNVRDLAIEKMSTTLTTSLNPFDKIILGKEYHVRKWLKEGCMALVNRYQGLTVEEGELLGLEMSIRIYHVREQGMQRRAHFSADTAVEQAFQIELASQQAEEEDRPFGLSGG